MFKTLQIVMRGRAYEAEERFADANALPVLRQQLRDAAHGLDRAKRSLAVVMAYAARERDNLTRIDAQHGDLEARAMDALEKGREDLATEAAGVLAGLEAERDMVGRALAGYEREIKRLRENVGLAEQRLRTLQRGKHLAEATHASQRLRGSMPAGVQASLAEAEATLERLQQRQREAEETEVALEALSLDTSAEATSARLAAAGCGAPLKPDTAAVLERLRSKMNEAKD